MEAYIPEGVTEGVSDACARDYALGHGLKLTEFLPDYSRFGRGAPLMRNITIIENADLVPAFRNGKSRGTKFVIDYRETGKENKNHELRTVYALYSRG